MIALQEEEEKNKMREAKAKAKIAHRLSSAIKNPPSLDRVDSIERYLISQVPAHSDVMYTTAEPVMNKHQFVMINTSDPRSDPADFLSDSSDNSGLSDLIMDEDCAADHELNNPDNGDNGRAVSAAVVLGDFVIKPKIKKTSSARNILANNKKQATPQTFHTRERTSSFASAISSQSFQDFEQELDEHQALTQNYMNQDSDCDDGYESDPNGKPPKKNKNKTPPRAPLRPNLLKPRNRPNHRSKMTKPKPPSNAGTALSSKVKTPVSLQKDPDDNSKDVTKCTDKSHSEEVPLIVDDFDFDKYAPYSDSNKYSPPHNSHQNQNLQPTRNYPEDSPVYPHHAPSSFAYTAPPYGYQPPLSYPYMAPQPQPYLGTTNQHIQEMHQLNPEGNFNREGASHGQHAHQQQQHQQHFANYNPTGYHPSYGPYPPHPYSAYPPVPPHYATATNSAAYYYSANPSFPPAFAYTYHSPPIPHSQTNTTTLSSVPPNRRDTASTKTHQNKSLKESDPLVPPTVITTATTASNTEDGFVPAPRMPPNGNILSASPTAVSNYLSPRQSSLTYGSVDHNRNTPSNLSKYTLPVRHSNSVNPKRASLIQFVRHPREVMDQQVDSVFSSVRSIGTQDAEELNEDAHKYFSSGVLARAFPERFLALFITLLVELPTLLMISGGSQQLCTLLGRSKYQLLMAFLPLTSAISGNCGLQGSTLTTRAVSHSQVTKQTFQKWLCKELLASLFLGTTMALVMGALAFVASSYDPIFAVTVAVAQILSIFTAGLTGTLAPLVFTFIFHRDSGKWGGPLETAIQDIVGSFAMVVLSYHLLVWMGPTPIDPNDICSLSVDF